MLRLAGRDTSAVGLRRGRSPLRRLGGREGILNACRMSHGRRSLAVHGQALPDGAAVDLDSPHGRLREGKRRMEADEDDGGRRFGR